MVAAPERLGGRETDMRSLCSRMWLVLEVVRVLHEAGRASGGARSESGGQTHGTERNGNGNERSAQGAGKYNDLAPARVHDPESFRAS